jgi:hypothetical protein
LFSMGILAEMLTAYQSRDEDAYSIADRTSRDGANTTEKKDQPRDTAN